ncbi:hypothetical protein AGDE_14986 [Angomonas deanei]|uniref:Uncharacterized protein n=1 Tax=Angomonas deanei TaxID=59799 RepID=A0A7G2CFK6_9TRYP|nr:hypothetical protein AGDE_14986 [Angomonas deanei]CAD2217473.1 hypothetical protein, conserved [Angomonas deanei]|eukprot:EPY19883.1 hypothetical protein AGDE_14986 [Angomonas deanei]
MPASCSRFTFRTMLFNMVNTSFWDSDALEKAITSFKLTGQGSSSIRAMRRSFESRCTLCTPRQTHSKSFASVATFNSFSSIKRWVCVISFTRATSAACMATRVTLLEDGGASPKRETTFTRLPEIRLSPLLSRSVWTLLHEVTSTRSISSKQLSHREPSSIMTPSQWRLSLLLSKGSDSPDTSSSSSSSFSLTETAQLSASSSLLGHPSSPYDAGRDTWDGSGVSSFWGANGTSLSSLSLDPDAITLNFFTFPTCSPSSTMGGLRSAPCLPTGLSSAVSTEVAADSMTTPLLMFGSLSC